jgi:hypothetical protein
MPLFPSVMGGSNHRETEVTHPGLVVGQRYVHSEQGSRLPTILTAALCRGKITGGKPRLELWGSPPGLGVLSYHPPPTGLSLLSCSIIEPRGSRQVTQKPPGWAASTLPPGVPSPQALSCWLSVCAMWMRSQGRGVPVGLSGEAEPGMDLDTWLWNPLHTVAATSGKARCPPLTTPSPSMLWHCPSYRNSGLSGYQQVTLGLQLEGLIHKVLVKGFI